MPGTGRLVRVDKASAAGTTIAAGLAFPTAAHFGPDGMLYASNRGSGFPPGSGEILRFDVRRDRPKEGQGRV